MKRDKKYTIAFKLNKLTEDQIHKIRVYMGSTRFVYNHILSEYLTSKKITPINKAEEKVDELIKIYPFLKSVDKTLLTSYAISAIKSVYAYEKSVKKFKLVYKSKKRTKLLKFPVITKDLLNEVKDMGIDISRYSDKIIYISIQSVTRDQYYCYITVSRTNSNNEHEKATA
ncbi:MAG: helix-turn-helix domain-containing protein [Candidatus Micrarchaeaceae archaeon]